MAHTRSSLLERKSLSEVHSTVTTDHSTFFKRLFAFAGPAYMVSVGYMDPGNWATDLAGGSHFGYELLWVLLLSNMMAILLQTLSARLGIVTGRDLAQACSETYSKTVTFCLWILCEIAIAACDLAEVIGTVIGLNLLFHMPFEIGLIITILDTFLLLFIQRLGIRKMEAFILVLVMTVGLCFIIEIVLAQPHWASVATGLLPSLQSKSPFFFSSKDALFIAIGILGATVMPHNLYLHSALVQSRSVTNTVAGKKQACRFNLFDSIVALNAAFFVNAAILVLAASAFFTKGQVVSDLRDAHTLLPQFLGSSVAATAFAIALLCSGQSSTLTGTLAGQITMEGFLHLRMRPWLRRLITRSLAIVPAMITVLFFGAAKLENLLILSQVVLSLQLPFAVVPLIQFTSDRRKMGEFATKIWAKILAWITAIIIVGLNLMLVFNQIADWTQSAAEAGYSPLLVTLTAWPIVAACGFLLVWLFIEPSFSHISAKRHRKLVTAAETVVALKKPLYKHIGVALENSHNDAKALQHAIALAKTHGAEIILLHVVDGVGGQWYGEQSTDLESTTDRQYMEEVRAFLTGEGIPTQSVLRYGKPTEQLIAAISELGIDFMVLHAHGHGPLLDLILGHTIDKIRHKVKIPVLAVREGNEKLTMDN